MTHQEALLEALNNPCRMEKHLHLTREDGELTKATKTMEFKGTAVLFVNGEFVGTVKNFSVEQKITITKEQDHERT